MIHALLSPIGVGFPMSDWGGEAACGKPLSGFVISGVTRMDKGKQCHE